MIRTNNMFIIFWKLWKKKFCVWMLMAQFHTRSKEIYSQPSLWLWIYQVFHIPGSKLALYTVWPLNNQQRKPGVIVHYLWSSPLIKVKQKVFSSGHWKNHMCGLDAPRWGHFVDHRGTLIPMGVHCYPLLTKFIVASLLKVQWSSLVNGQVS